MAIWVGVSHLYMPIENEQVKDYQHPKPVIYLDRNAFSLVTKYAKTQDPKLEKFATLVDHLGKRNSLPFSDIHLFELMNTGRKSDLSPVEKENFINIDLKIMKLISKDEIIYFDNKGTCRVTNSCPESKYKEIMLLEGFEEIYYDLLDLMPKAMIKKLRKITGLGPRELNNKTSSEADKAIENSMERLLELSTIENIENDEEYKNLMLEQAQKSLMLMDKVEKWLFDLVTHLMQSLSNEQKEIALKALEDFKIKFQEAKELNLKNIDDLNSGEILKSMKSPDAIKKCHRSSF